MPDLKQLYESVVSGDAKTTQALTKQALADGVDPLKLVNDYMVPAMDEVGRRFEANEYFVPELLISARAMKSALELIRPLLTARGDQPLGRVAIGTVKGDLHDIGKNLVGSLLEGAGSKSSTWCQCDAGGVHRYHQREEGQYHRHVRVADDDDAFDEDHY